MAKFRGLAGILITALAIYMLWPATQVRKPELLHWTSLGFLALTSLIYSLHVLLGTFDAD